MLYLLTLPHSLKDPYPIEQGLKPRYLERSEYRELLKDPYPIEQGLKLEYSSVTWGANELKDPYPIEQGLKLGHQFLIISCQCT